MKMALFLATTLASPPRLWELFLAGFSSTEVCVFIGVPFRSLFNSPFIHLKKGKSRNFFEMPDRFYL
jgi:hypothetical protein